MMMIIIIIISPIFIPILEHGTCPKQKYPEVTSGRFVIRAVFFYHIFCQSLFEDTSCLGQIPVPLGWDDFSRTA